MKTSPIRFLSSFSLLLGLALIPQLLRAQVPTTRTWTGAGGLPAVYTQAVNWSPNTAAPGVNDFVRFDGTGASGLVVFPSTSRDLNVLNAAVDVAYAVDWRFTGTGIDAFSSILIGGGGSLFLSPVPVTVAGAGVPGIASPMRLTAEAMVLGNSGNSPGQFSANAEQATVDLNLHGSLIVGNQSLGLFSLINGARATVGGAMNIGQFTVGAARTDTVLLQGAGTSLSVPNGRINVSGFNPAQFTVRDGAVASSSDMRIASGNSGNGTVLVFGTNSRLTMPGELRIADMGIGALLIRQGGRVVCSGGSLGQSLAAAAGTVTVENAGSRWEIAGGLTVGDRGRGTLNVNDQAVVTANSARVAVQPGSQGAINLAAGTRLDVAQELSLGGDTISAGGPASLSVPGGATLNAGTLRLWSGSSMNISGGTLNLGRILGTSAITFSSGIVNLTDTDVTVGESSLLPNGGQLGVNRNIYITHGLTVPANNQLRIAGGNFTAARVGIAPGALFGSVVPFPLSAPVENRGVLEGPTTPGSYLTINGNVTGAGNCLNNVAFAAGYFPGAFGPARVPLQNGRFTSSSTLHLNLGGTAAAERDSLLLSTLTLEGGTLDVALTNGFIPAAGDEFDLLDWTTLNGTFGGLNLPALPDNLFWNTTQLYTTGRISVVMRSELRLAGVSTQAGNSLQVQGSGEPGSNYSLQSSTDLTTWSWRANLITDAGGLWFFLDTGALTASPRRFYRVIGEPTLPSGLVSYYHAEFDYRDSFGPNNGMADATSPSFAAGRNGQSFSFNGNNHILNLGAAPISPDWTVALWVNHLDSADASSALLWNRTPAGTGSALKLEQFGVAGRRTGFTQFGVADYAFAYSAPINTWTHLAFVGTATSTALYVNGTLSETIPAGIPLPFAQLGGPAGDRLRGQVDELTIFNRTLTAAEIQQVRDATGGP